MIGKCQYCGGPALDSYTCMICALGWPRDKCKCENNGDYCESCERWIEQRRATVQRVAVSRKLALEIGSGLNNQRRRKS